MNHCFLPVSIRIDGKAIVLIGGGRVALHKAVLLSRFTQTAKVVAPEFDPGFASVPFERIGKHYEPADLDGAWLVYICTGDRALNAEVKAECERRGVLASVCDDPALCDFISPAIHREGNVTLAVSSDAKDVRRSIRIRDRIKLLVEEGRLSLQ
ncbi:MAG: bifunctional precorrin-2 dehydrogenase/sirohydrochlorin ferrochelatase [Tannerella sp.]|jgi:siroheme synthase-like protein|nr:bifunctional precorrin-2 dehydrogenase/sirohydrochlorin ferrochelatase [Tannerella sp.]